MIKKTIILGIILLTSNYIYAQGKMSLNEAILQALESNRNIKIANNSVIMTENLSSLGQAGLLPSLNASGMADYGKDNYTQQLKTSTNTLETKGAASTIYNASLNLNYTIFSGFGNKYTYEKLKTNIHLVDAESKVSIENIILQVAANYYNVIRTDENYQALLESIEISQKRYELAQAKNEYSGGTKLDLLNVRVDLNKDSVILYDALLAKETALLSFNKIVGFPLDTNLTLVNNFAAKDNYNYDELKQQMISQNYELTSLKYKEQVSMLDYKIARSTFYPSLNLGSSYSFSDSDADYSVYDINRSNGFGVNLSLSIPIYNGGRKRSALNNTKIMIENSALQTEELSLQLELELLSAYKDYQNALQKVRMEETNVETARLNFDLTVERYKLGQVINTQFREAQFNLIMAKNSYNNSAFNARLSELEIIKLSGLLLNQN